MSEQRLTGKRAVITGGTTGLGFAMAELFLAHGARVCITGQDQERLDAAVSSLGPQAMGVRADVTQLADLANLAERLQESLGGLDVLVANAGVGHFAPLGDITESDYDRLFDTNVKGVFFTVQQLTPLLNDGASVILVASAAHVKGRPNGSIYIAGKAAVRTFARCMATELGPKVRVNALSPGGVATPFQEKLHNPNHMAMLKKTFEESTPLHRLGTEQDMASAALFLASGESAFMTGADLVVDGGYSTG